MAILWSGLAIGAVYALVALTNNITLSQAGIFNFAQAQYLVCGIYLAYGGITQLDLPWYVVSLGSGIILAAVGCLQERLTIRPLGGLEAGHSAALVTTVGVSTVTQGIVFVIWGGTPLGLGFFGGEQTISIFGGRLQPVDVYLFLMAMGLAVLLWLVATRTRWGLAGRAATADEDAARLLGVNVERLTSSSFMLAGFIGGVLGPFLAPKIGVAFELTGVLVIYGFVALALGGFGSYPGAVIGGLGVGLIQSYVTRYLELHWFAILLFAALLLVLMVRPTGLLGRRGLRTV